MAASLTIGIPSKLRRWSAPLVASAILLTAGCGGESQKEVSAKQTKYQAAEEEGNKTATATPPSKTGGAATNANADAAAKTGGADNQAVAPMPPAFGASAEGDTRSFMTLKPTTSKEPRELMQFLAKADQAYKELLMAAQSLQVNQSTMAERLQSIFAMKLSAAKTLAEVATAQEEKEVAVYAKIEALSHLAGIGDTNAAKELEEYAQEISKIENPKMAHQAKLVLLSFRVGEYDSGVLKSPDEILKEIEAFLADKSLLTQTDFRMMIQILNAFQKQGHTDAISVAKEKIGNAFVEHPNTRLAMDAWMLRADGSKVIDALRASVEQIAKNPSDASLAEGFKKVIADLQTAYPEPTTLLMLANYVINLESIGALASAQTITESLKSQLDKIQDERQRQEIDRILQDAEKHFAFLGKPLDLSKLVTLDGKPLDTATLKNKVVLVDFWATWCQPCLASFPELKTLYEKHKDKGFEIVGVNIDDELAAVQEFMKKDALPWTIVRSVDTNAPDAVGFKAPFATEIGVNAIPMVLIVDREGKTVAINLRENAFVEKIESLIATP